MLLAISLSERHALTLYIFLVVAGLAGAWTLLGMIFRFIREIVRKYRNNKEQ